MKKNWIFLLILVCLISGCGLNATRLKKESVIIATGDKGGTYYPLGTALADILNKNIQGCKAKTYATPGSVKNAMLVHNGAADVAFIQGDIAYYAFHGIEMFDGIKMNDLRCLACLYPEYVQAVVTKKSGIKKILDLQGKRISVGTLGGGTEINARQILEIYGLSFENVELVHYDFDTSAKALLNGEIDCFFVTAGFPTPALENVALKNDLRVLPIDADKAEKLIKKYSFYSKGILGSSRYSEKDLPGISVECMMIVNKKMELNDGFYILETMYNCPTILRRVSTAANVIARERGIDGMSITGHDGAAKYFILTNR